MKGIKYRHICGIIDFMYKGEANVLQDDLEGFHAIYSDFQYKDMEYKCDICDKYFNRGKHLKKHIKRHHQDISTTSTNTTAANTLYK